MSFLTVKLFHFLQYRILVESASDCMTRWTKHLNDWPSRIKENLFRTYRSLGNTWAFLIFSISLLIISPSLWLKRAPRFHQQVRNNPTITAFACFQKFPGTFKGLCLLLLSEQMRYPPSTNLSRVQTLFVPRLFEEKRRDTVFRFPWHVVRGSKFLVGTLSPSHLPQFLSDPFETLQVL